MRPDVMFMIIGALAVLIPLAIKQCLRPRHYAVINTEEGYVVCPRDTFRHTWDGMIATDLEGIQRNIDPKKVDIFENRKEARAYAKKRNSPV